MASIDSDGRYTSTGAPAWLGLNPDGSQKKKSSSGASNKVAVPHTYEMPDYSSEIRDYIEDMYKAQRESIIAGLDKSRSAALSNLGRERATIQPQYYDKRNQANVVMNNNARNFSEYLAQRGLQSSGVAAQGTLNNLNAYQGTLGELGRQEQQAYDDIARRTSDIENAYLSDIQAAEAGIQSQQMQALIAEMQRQRDLAIAQDQFNRQFGLSEAGLTGIYNGMPTLDALNAQRQFGLQEAGLTGVYNGMPTLSAQELAMNRAFGEAGLTGTYNGVPTLQGRQVDMAEALQNWNTGSHANAFEFQKALENLAFQNSLKLQNTRSSGGGGGGSYGGSNLTKTEARDINMTDYKSAIDSVVNQANRYVTNSTSAYKVYTNILDMIERDSQALRSGGLTNSDIENLKKYAREKVGI